MKLFISYSRQDERKWALEFWRAIRDDVHHDAWIDQRIVPAQDWWKTILDEIEACDCFIYVMTPKSVESIYCLAELEYALAINKPVLPLKLKDSDEPESLKELRIQYQVVSDTMTMDQVLLAVERGLSEVRVQIERGQYTPISVTRPDVPKQDKGLENIFKVFALAEELFAEGNFQAAKQRYKQVVIADPDGLGEAAKTRLNEIDLNHECATNYAMVKRLLENPKTLEGARIAWREFAKKYPEYDPDNLAGQLHSDKEAPSPKPKTEVDVSNSDDILPSPFEWMDIPRGKVIQKSGEYSGKVDVPAFAIAKYPVTNVQFARFIKAQGYTQREYWTEAGWQEKEKGGWTKPRFWGERKWSHRDQPVVGVSWYEAVAFCQWLSGISGETILLPTEQQWQRAAQGGNWRAYPWGDKWDCWRCNNSVSPCTSDGTTPVTQYEGNGDSPFGVVDMVGNVWEWCLTKYDTGRNEVDGTNVRILRGGSWDFYSSDFFHITKQYWDDPGDRINGIGFRIALSYT